MTKGEYCFTRIKTCSPQNLKMTSKLAWIELGLHLVKLLVDHESRVSIPAALGERVQVVETDHIANIEVGILEVFEHFEFLELFGLD